MGGAINVLGNLENPLAIPKEVANNKGEWNVFWDPNSTKWIFENISFPIIELSLSITDKAEITNNLLRKLNNQGKNINTLN